MDAQRGGAVDLHELSAWHLEAAGRSHVEHRLLGAHLIEAIIVAPELQDHRRMRILVGGLGACTAE